MSTATKATLWNRAPPLPRSASPTSRAGSTPKTGSACQDLRTSNDLALSKPLNVRLAVAEARQDLVVVLAELGRNTNLGRCFRELPRRAVNPQALAVLGIVDLADVAVGHDIGVCCGLEHRVDRRRDDIGGPELGHPVVARVGREQTVEQGEQLGPPTGTVHGLAQVTKASLLHFGIKAEADHRLLPLVAGKLEHHGLAVTIVEA